MSIEVALQSVAFYVLSCSTCAKINHRRKAKVQAKRERAEKHELETEQPGLYRHPSPFSTNPYWDEEIMMGPGPPKKKADKNSSQRGLTTAGPGSSYANSSTMSTDAASSPTAVEGSRISGEGWNLKRYQREDEALWGHDTHGPGQRILDAISRAGSTAGRLLEERLNSRKTPTMVEEEPPKYYLAKNPPVNDLHPPVVSTQPASRDETRWMLQPPPSAKVMEGKERVVRSRATSNGSSRKGADGSPLSRQVTEKLVDAKLQRGEMPYLEVGRVSSRPESKSKSLNRPRGQRHERNETPDSIHSSDSSESSTRRRARPPRISVSPAAMISRDNIENIPIQVPAPAATEMRERVTRPTLPTIPSSSNPVPHMKKSSNNHLPLREVSPRSSNSAMNSRDPSPTSRLSPNANSMPATIPSVESKFPGAQSFVFPKPTAVEITEPVGLGIETAKAR